MANDYFQFKQFTVWQQHCAMKVTTDGCLLGAWAARTMVDGGQITDDKLSLPVMPSAKETGVHGYSDAPQPSTINRPSAAILDIGTGTGLLSLMLAQKTDLSIDAVEIDPAAAEQARQNCKASPWGHRIRVITGNIIQLAPGQRYTTIISNPPFFENQLASPHVGRQKALHATELSLAALLLAIDQHLHPQGMAFIMLPAYREPEIATLMVPYGFCLRQLVTVRHSPNHPPFRILIQLGREAATPLPYELVIRENDGGYSEAFNALLKDYYLHL